MTDLDRAIAAAREALDNHDYGHEIPAYVVRDLLAALDAAQGRREYIVAEVQNQIPTIDHYTASRIVAMTIAMSAAPPAALAEPLFLLHTGAVYGNERGDWEIEASSGDAVDAYCDANPGKTIGLYLATQAQQPAALAVPDAMRVVTDAMRSDPEYAWAWHCNIAMAFFDEGGDHAMANHAAARFMRLLANVEPAHELPPKQAQQPAAAVPAEWRVVWFTGSFKRGSERWEIYDPEGNGGAIDKGDIRDDMVWGLLDALAAANKESSND